MSDVMDGKVNMSMLASLLVEDVDCSSYMSVTTSMCDTSSAVFMTALAAAGENEVSRYKIMGTTVLFTTVANCLVT